MRQLTALLLCTALLTGGCASTPRRAIVGPSPQTAHGADPQLMSDFVAQLPIGSRLKVTLGGRRQLRGTLMSRDAERIVLLLRTRLPEAPVDVAIRDITAIDLDVSDGSVGRMIAIGAATGAAATFAVLLLLAAIYSD